MSSVLRFSVLFLSLFFISSFAKKQADASNFSLNADSVNKYQPRSNISKDVSRKSKIYFGIGVGTNGPSIVGAFYFNNFFGIRGEFSGIPTGLLVYLVDKYVDNNMALNGKILNLVNEKLIGNYLSDTMSDIGLGNVRLDGIGVKTTKAFQSWGFDLSLRPFRGIWRIDVGVRNMDYRLGLDIEPFISKETAVSIIENKFGDQVREYNVDLSKVLNNDKISITAGAEIILAKGWRPYFGTGFDIPIGDNFRISFDAGVIYLGDPMRLSRIGVSVSKLDFNKTYIEKTIVENGIKIIKENIPEIPRFEPVTIDIPAITIGTDFDNDGHDDTIIPGDTVTVGNQIAPAINNSLNILDKLDQQRNFDDVEKWWGDLTTSVGNINTAIDAEINGLKTELSNQARIAINGEDGHSGINEQIRQANIGIEAANAYLPENMRQQKISEIDVKDVEQQISNKIDEAYEAANVPNLSEILSDIDISKYRKQADDTIDSFLGYDLEALIKEKLGDYLSADRINDLVHNYKIKDIPGVGDAIANANVPAVIGNVKVGDIAEFMLVVKVSFGLQFDIG